MAEDLNIGPLMGTINNGFEVADGASEELVTNSSDIGDLLLVLGIVIVVAVLIAVAFGIPQKIIKSIGNLFSNMKKLG